LRQSGPGRKFVEDLFKFTIGERGRLTWEGLGTFRSQFARRPDGVPLDEAEDVRVDRLPIAGRALP
jgi:hypothetical protein